MLVAYNTEFEYDGQWKRWEKIYFEKHWSRLYSDYVNIVNPLLESINNKYNDKFSKFDWKLYHRFLWGELLPHMFEYNVGPKADKYIALATDPKDGSARFLLKNGNGKVTLRLTPVEP